MFGTPTRGKAALIHGVTSNIREKQSHSFAPRGGARWLNRDADAARAGRAGRWRQSGSGGEANSSVTKLRRIGSKSRCGGRARREGLRSIDILVNNGGHFLPAGWHTAIEGRPSTAYGGERQGAVLPHSRSRPCEWMESVRGCSTQSGFWGATARNSRGTATPLVEGKRLKTLTSAGAEFGFRRGVRVNAILTGRSPDSGSRWPRYSRGDDGDQHARAGPHGTGLVDAGPRFAQAGCVYLASDGTLRVHGTVLGTSTGGELG